MAEKDDRKDDKEAAAEETEEKGPDDENMPESGQEEQEKNGNVPNRRFFGYKKWILLSIFFLILVFIGVSIRWIPNLLSFKRDGASFSAFAEIEDDHLMEENLSPFFIPPSSDSSRGAVRIDLSAIWDGLASIRFQKNKIRTRSRIYEYIRGLAEKNEDLHPIIPVLEKEMSRIFQESLGVRGLNIRIREIKYL